MAGQWAPVVPFHQGAGYLNLAIPALAREWNHQDGSAPLASFGNEFLG